MSLRGSARKARQPGPDGEWPPHLLPHLLDIAACGLGLDTGLPCLP